MKKLLLSYLWLIPSIIFAQITIDESLSTQQLVEDILINSNCAGTANFVSSTGTDFGDVNGIAAFAANGSDFPFSSGIILSSGNVAEAPGPNTSVQSNGGWPGDADLEAFTTATSTNNASFIQFDFVPFTDQLSFDFIMASEEYNQNFECTFSDAFAFILTDQATGTSENLAVLPGTTTPIEVTNIRPEVPGNCGAVNEQFFDKYNFLPFNDQNSSATNFNGQTVELTASATVVAGQTYTIKLVAADQSDSAFDIAVFLEAGSFNIGNTELGEDILVSNGLAACDGDSITLDATDPDADSYTWLINDVEIPGETDPTLEVTVEGTYSVIVTLADVPDCEVRDEIFVEFITVASVEIGPDRMSCEGDTETFDTGLPADSTTFVWTLDGSPIAGETGPSLDVTMPGLYEVTATFDAGCSYSDSASAVFNVTPTLDLGPDINSCFDMPITLDGTPDNVDPATATYEWTLDGVTIIGATMMTLEVSEAGAYEVFVTFDNCTGTDSIIVNQAAPDGSSCIANDSCFEAEEVVCGDIIDGTTIGAFDDDAPGQCGTNGNSAGIWYTFTGTGDLIQLGLCNSNYDTKLQVFTGTCDALACVGGNDDSCGLQSEVDFISTIGTVYSIYVSGFGGQTGDFELTVACVEAPQGCLDAEEVVCGDTVTGTTVGAPLTDVPVELCGNNAPTEPGVWYTFTGTGQSTQLSLCNSSFDTFLQVYTGGCENLQCETGNNNFCGDQSQVEFLTTTGTEYFIYIYGSQGESGDYELTVTCSDPETCVDAQPFCTAEGIIFDNTSDGSAAQNGIDYECLGSQPNPSWFYIEIENPGNLNLEIVQNTQFNDNGDPIGNPLDVDFIAWGPFTDTDAGCANLNPSTSVDCSFSAAPVEEFLIPNAQEGEVYIILITNFNGSAGFISLQQTGGQGGTTCDILCDFDIDLGPDQSICDNSGAIELTAILSGTDIMNPSYLWSTGATTPSILVNDSGDYTVEVTINGCTELKTVNIQLGTTPVIDLGADFDSCFDAAVILDASASNLDATDVDYEWMQDGIAIPDTTPTIEVVEPGVYSVTATNNGCTTTDTITITPGSLSVSVQDDFSSCPDQTQTLVTTTDSTDANFQWFLNDDPITGATASSLEISLPASTVGTQQYRVEVTKGSCIGSDTVDVTLYEVGQCIISQGISPNGSPGFNDSLDLTFLSDRSGISKLQIFNRLGSVVFEKTEYTDQWRGQAEGGNDLPTGTYFYVIDFVTPDEEFGAQTTGWIYLNQND